MKVWANLGNQTRENLCEKRDFGRKCRGVWRKNLKSFLENSFTFGGKRKCVWVQMYLRFWKCVSETSERGKWMKTFEDFRCWNEINYGWNESFFLFCVYLDLVVLYCVIDCFFVIMFVFGLILCSLEIVSRHLVAKNEITGFGLLNYRILMRKSVIWHFVRCEKFALFLQY